MHTEPSNKTAWGGIFVFSESKSEQLDFYEQAPRKVLDQVQAATDYRAVLKKRWGNLSPEEFLHFCRRFVLICNQVYQGTQLEVRVNEEVPLDAVSALVSQGLYEPDRGQVIPHQELLTEKEFERIFSSSRSITVTLKPLEERSGLEHSFAKVEWSRDRAGTIFFYAQDGAEAFEALDGLLSGKLYRQMFFVHSSAPSFRFSVGLGINAYLNEKERDVRF